MIRHGVDLSTVEVLDLLPSFFGRGHGEVPPGLIGATIVAFGTLPVENCQALEGGGLIIDYRPKGSEEARRVAFGFNELALWVDYEGPLKAIIEEREAKAKAGTEV